MLLYYLLFKTKILYFLIKTRELGNFVNMLSTSLLQNVPTEKVV